MLKSRRGLLLLLLIVALALATSAAWAQSGDGYDLSWWTVDGGGGRSTGGGYTLEGTVGQPDAATWSGGGYTLAGGFWGGLAVEYRVYLPLVMNGY